MTKRAVLIPAYGKPSAIDNTGLDSLQAAVGGYIEGIDLRFALRLLTDNAAFADGAGPAELSDILRHVAEDVAEQGNPS